MTYLDTAPTIAKLKFYSDNMNALLPRTENARFLSVVALSNTAAVVLIAVYLYLARLIPLTPTVKDVVLTALVILWTLLIRLQVKYAREEIFSHRARRHRRFQAQARAVLAKLRTIEHPAQRLSYLRKISPLVFEEVLLEAFELRGCPIELNDRYTGDGGIDGKFYIGNAWYFVQAKRYCNHINPAHVTDFIGIVEQSRCKGIFCHTGRTGGASKTLTLHSTHVSIISGDRLLSLLNVAQPWQFQRK
jgi:restriction system protein